MESSGGASTTGCGPVEMLPCRTWLRVSRKPCKGEQENIDR
nr:hypothetical protein [Tanacetum cinerariifolium]